MTTPRTPDDRPQALKGMSAPVFVIVCVLGLAVLAAVIAFAVAYPLEALKAVLALVVIGAFLRLSRRRS